MKNLVKFAAVAAVVFGASSVAGAQTGFTPGTQGANNSNVINGASITAKATVADAISATGAKNLDFGTIYRLGGVKTIAANSGSAGVFTIAGGAGSAPTVSFTGPTGGYLSGTTLSSNHLIVNLTYASAASGGVCSATATGFTSGGPVTLDALGGATMCVGGATEAPTSSTALDSYTGTVTMTVTF